jgi:hypothetical protein
MEAVMAEKTGSMKIWDQIRWMWSDDAEGKIIVLLVLSLPILVGLAIYAGHREAEQWAAFSAANNCRVVERTRATTETGIGHGLTPSGNMGFVVTTSTTPARAGYLCDDGVVYWR